MRNPRGMASRTLDPLTGFFWNVQIDLKPDATYKQFTDACWEWRGPLVDTTPRYYFTTQDEKKQEFRSATQFIFHQLHPGTSKRHLNRICEDDSPVDLCVNPWHRVQGKKSAGRKPATPIPLIFPETENRPALLHYTWRNLVEREAETIRQRNLPGYLTKEQRPRKTKKRKSG